MRNLCAGQSQIVQNCHFYHHNRQLGKLTLPNLNPNALTIPSPFFHPLTLPGFPTGHGVGGFAVTLVSTSIIKLVSFTVFHSKKTLHFHNLYFETFDALKLKQIIFCTKIKIQNIASYFDMKQFSNSRPQNNYFDCHFQCCD